MSRAVIHESFGGPEVLEVREVDEPHAGPGEVRVRVTAACLNPMDWLLASVPEVAARFGYTVPVRLRPRFRRGRRRGRRRLRGVCGR